MIVIGTALLLVFSFHVWLGFRRGLFRSLLGLVSVAVALLAAYLLMPLVRGAIVEHTRIDDKIHSKVYSEMKDILFSETKDRLEVVGYSEKDAVREASAQTESRMAEEADEDTKNSILGGLELPRVIKDKLNKGNTDKGWKKLGVNNFFDYLAARLTNMLINLISAVIVYIVARLILYLICRLFYGAINQFVIVYGVDKGLGMVFGAAMGLLFVWVAMAVFSLVGSAGFRELADKVPLVKLVSDMNPIVHLIMK